MAHEFTTSYVAEALAVFRQYKGLAEAAMGQIGDEQLFESLDLESNSIAIIVKHVAGNLRSRWTNFLATDGEKADRNRDGEFMDPAATRESLMADWEDGWSRLFAALEPLKEEDLRRTVTIRGERHSVMQAINRAGAHTANHVGQIVLLAKHFAGSEWRAITIPRGKSQEFSGRVAAGELSQR